MPKGWRGLLSMLLWAAALGQGGAALAQAGDLSDITCPPTETPPKAAPGVIVEYLTQDYERNWPQTWVCNPLNDPFALLLVAQVKREDNPWTGEPSYIFEYKPRRPAPFPRWHAQLSWKLLVSTRRDSQAPATLIVKAEYEQPSLARFDMFVSLTGKGVRGTSTRVLNESASEACLKVRNDCKHTEEIVLEIPRSVLRSAIRTGLLIDLLGHGRTERLAVSKEVVWALSEKAQIR